MKKTLPMPPSNKSYSMTSGQIEAASQFFAALAEPARLRLVQSLMESDLTVSEIIEVTGFKQANASKHLGILLRVGLVKKSKEGTFSRYALADPFVHDLCFLVCNSLEQHASKRLQSLK
jgi:DNA-binding transcriptional ArsR family regulator